MDKILVRGGKRLSGEIVIGGAKNAALPLMACGLLTDERLVLTNVPHLDDIKTMALLLAQHGIAVEPGGNGGRVLSLFAPPPFVPAVGDVLRLQPGCDKRKATCQAVFGNYLNFRGEPFIPGALAVLETPA